MKHVFSTCGIMVLVACSAAFNALGCTSGDGDGAPGGTGGGVGGEGGSGAIAGAGGAGGAVEMPIDVSATGRVGLGTIGGATIEVFAYDDLDTPLLRVGSSMGTLEETGRFSFELDQVLPSDLFLMVVIGGAAVDVNEDGVADAVSTANAGTFHCVATAAQLNEADVLISAMSELIYWRLRYLIGAGYEASFVSAAADSWATHVLSSSIDGDDDVDWNDVLAFDGTLHQDKTIRPYSQYSPTALNVLGGAPLHVAGFELTRAEIAFLDGLGNGRDVDLVDGRAYLTAGDSLRIFDVSDPTNPTELGSYVLTIPTEVAVIDNLAYVLDANLGLQILDITNPAVVALVGGVVIPSGRALQIVGELAYVVQDSFGDAMVHVVDVSEPTTPSIIGSASVSGSPQDLTVRGSHVYVSKSNAPIEIFDVSNPAEPESVGNALDSDNNAGLAIAGDDLLATTREGLTVFDLSEPDDPISIATVSLPSDDFAGSITVVDSRAYLDRGFDGIHVIDVSNPATPTRLGVLPISSVQNSVAVEGALMITADGNRGLHTAAAGTPIASAAVAEVRFTGRPVTLVATETRTYVGTRSPNELWVVDTIDPLMSARDGGLVLPSTPRELQVADGLVFAATERDGLLVIDASDAAMPIVVGDDGTEQTLSTLTLTEGTAYAGSGRELHVIDITTPTSPVPLAPVTLNRQVSCTEVDGDTLLVCQDFSGVQAVDLTVPTSPMLGTLLADTSNASDIAVRAGKAFVADFSGAGIDAGIQVVDYMDVNTPVAEGRLVLPGNAQKIAIGGEHAYVVAGAVGVEVANVADSTDVRHVGSLPLAEEADDVSAGEDFVYAIGSRHLFVMRGFVRNVP